MKGTSKKKAGRVSLEPTPLELLEEGVRLLRAHPSILAIHLVGSIPFTALFLYFWADMSRGAFAADRVVVGALMLSSVFLCMKTLHGVFATELLTRLQGATSKPWTLQRLWRLGSTQALIQPWGLLLIPAPVIGTVIPLLPSNQTFVAILMALLGIGVGIGFGWFYAFFQGASVVADRAEGVARVCARDALKQAMKWPGGNHGSLGLLGVFALVVFLNSAAGLYTLPMLVKMLLGIESEYTLSSNSWLNTTFFASAAALTWHILDPLAKAFYVLRTFRTEAIETGADIRARLSASRHVVVMVLFIGLGFGIALPRSRAAETETAPGARPQRELPSTSASGGDKASTHSLDKAMDEVLRRRAYTWREPRDLTTANDKSDQDWLSRAVNSVTDSIDALLRKLARSVSQFLDWILNGQTVRGPTPQGGSFFDWTSGLNGVLYSVLAVAIGVLGFLLLRAWKRREPTVIPEALATPVTPDLRNEDVAANQLPEEGWLTMARDLAARGEHRLALRALYLAALASLAHRELVSLARHKTNRDYTREVERRGRATPQLPELFKGIAASFDRAWYGTFEVTPDTLKEFETRVASVRSPGLAAPPVLQ